MIRNETTVPRVRSRRPVVWSHAIDSCPSHDAGGGFFFEEEAIRTALTEMLRAGAGLQMLEEALLDVAPDEALDMLKRKSMHKWDARKKKYVQQSVSEIIDTRGKKQKNESGQDVKKGATRGELYRKWRERKGGDERVDYRGAKGSRSKKKKAPSAARPVKDEVRNAAQIAKQRREKRDLALKNLPKAKRRALTHKK